MRHLDDETARVIADELEAQVMETGAPSDTVPSIYDVLIATAPRRIKRARAKPARARPEQPPLRID